MRNHHSEFMFTSKEPKIWIVTERVIWRHCTHTTQLLRLTLQIKQLLFQSKNIAEPENRIMMDTPTVKLIQTCPVM